MVQSYTPYQHGYKYSKDRGYSTKEEEYSRTDTTASKKSHPFTA